MVSSTAPITSSLPYACAPFRRGYDHRPDLLFHSVRAGSSPRRTTRLYPPPHFCSHYTTRGKIISERQRTAGGGIFIPGGRRCKKIEKKSQSAQNCRTVPKIPYSISLYIEPNYTLSLYIEPNYTLS